MVDGHTLGVVGRRNKVGAQQTEIIMQIIDSHVHIWTHEPQYPWAAEEQNIPSVDARADDLMKVLKRNGVERAVLVQYIKYRWDNHLVAHTLKTHPTLFMGVCRVDPENPDSPDQLSYWTEVHGFRGVRIGQQPDERKNWYSDSLMVPLFRRAAVLKIPVFILTKPDFLKDIARILNQVPDVDVVIDHLADCLNRDEATFEKLLGLARYPRLFLKLGHIAQNSSEGFPWRDTHFSLEKIFQSFGAQRIMWGSDWPFSLSHMSYEQSLAFIQDQVEFLTPVEREWALGKTALQIWK
jgi:L-fuconolactonase